jgi:tRNA(Ile)-lysidine synthase
VVRRPLVPVERAVRDALAGPPEQPRVVLAVSGGRDSMVLLEAAARAARQRIVAVATFDHGTGDAATHAADLVEARAAELGLRLVRGGEAARGAPPESRPTEAAWREARWRFLLRLAEAEKAVVATGHTRDDQVETVLLRILRGTGARGLAGLAAPTRGIVRPLLAVSRRAVAAYAAARRLRWVDDPSNLSVAHLRNRVRHELLPALLRARPSLAEELLALASEAAELRRALENLVAKQVDVRFENGELVVARDSLARYDAQELAVLWPVIAARSGVALDRRGTRRLSAFTKEGSHGRRIQLSGGLEVVLHAGELRLRRAASRAVGTAREIEEGLTVGSFRFRVLSTGGSADSWWAELPADRRLTARAWHPGDRMTPAGATSPRRVKRLLREAAIDAAARRGWPVVLADDEIVWVPGVRRALAATARPGGPVVRVQCERILDR